MTKLKIIFSKSLAKLCFAMLIIFFSLQLAVLAEDGNLGKIKIISAEKLDYQDGNSTLIGNVKIQIGNFTIEAPQAFIDADSNGESSYARFVGGVSLDSDRISIIAPRMDIDVNKSLLKSFSSEEELVVTTIVDKKQANLYAQYQEINLATGFAQANSGNAEDMMQVKYVSEDMNISSDKLELELKELSELKYINFLSNVVAISDKLRVESQDLVYFPSLDLVKANDDVRLLFLSGTQQGSYLFSDSAIYEQSKNLLSVFSRGPQRFAEIHSDQIFGKARQILVNIDEDHNIDNAILTGNAYAQHQSKSLLGHEILLDIKNHKLETSVGRPRTRLLR
ncbi:MAG: hypothetical protein O3C63_04540 [Cyanobacteria bacterium]|nr:hypothetical protein [Cyanobacteriota bacterium]MDA1021194.1 hypothetical protein [Cyanobacteriota bacterium]